MSQEDIQNAIDELVQDLFDRGAATGDVISGLELKLYALREELEAEDGE